MINNLHGFSWDVNLNMIQIFAESRTKCLAENHPQRIIKNSWERLPTISRLAKTRIILRFVSWLKCKYYRRCLSRLAALRVAHIRLIRERIEQSWESCLKCWCCVLECEGIILHWFVTHWDIAGQSVTLRGIYRCCIISPCTF